VLILPGTETLRNGCPLPSARTTNLFLNCPTLFFPDLHACPRPPSRLSPLFPIGSSLFFSYDLGRVIPPYPPPSRTKGHCPTSRPQRLFPRRIISALCAIPTIYLPFSGRKSAGNGISLFPLRPLPATVWSVDRPFLPTAGSFDPLLEFFCAGAIVGWIASFARLSWGIMSGVVVLPSFLSPRAVRFRPSSAMYRGVNPIAWVWL